MLVLFSSSARPRYKQNAINCMCYPIGHVVRFRYEERHVDSFVRDSWKPKPSGRVPVPAEEAGALIVFADAKEVEPDGGFRFFAIRRARLRSLRCVGSVYYADVELGSFQVDELDFEQLEHPLPELSVDEASQAKFSQVVWAAENGSADYKKTVVAAGETMPDDYHRGRFLVRHGEPQGWFDRQKERASRVRGRFQDGRVSVSEAKAWEALVRRVNEESRSLQSALFFMVSGFYRPRVALKWMLGSEKRVVPTANGPDTRYQLRAGAAGVLRLLFYRSRSAGVAEATLKFETQGKLLETVSPMSLEVGSRYNEERVLLGTSRVLDASIGELRLKPSDEDKGLDCPRPTFVVTAAPPRGSLIVILVGLVLAPILLSLSPDYWKAIAASGWLSDTPSGKWILDHAGVASSTAKVAAAIVTLVAGWVGLRKLPLK